jgi:cryptochrome
MASSHKDAHEVSVYWFRNALRLHDNPSLLAAAEESKHVLFLYAIDPEAPFCQTDRLKAGTIRANFILESLREMDAKLRALHSRLYVVKGAPEHVVPEVVASFQASALFYEKEAAAPIRDKDAAVLAAIQRRLKQGGSRQTCEIRGFETHNLHSMETYLSHCKNNVAPASFGSFSKIFQKLQIPKEVDIVTQVPPLPENGTKMMQSRYDKSVDVPSLEDLGYTDVAASLKSRDKGGIKFEGGEDAGLALMKQMMARSRWIATFEKPKTSPNALSVDTTGLSPCKSTWILSLYDLELNATRSHMVSVSSSVRHQARVCFSPSLLS